MWCCPEQCRVAEVGLAPSDDQDQDQDHDDHVLQDQDDHHDDHGGANLMCECQGEGGY